MLGGGAFGRCLGPKGGALLSRISVLIKGTPPPEFLLLYTGKSVTRKRAIASRSGILTSSLLNGEQQISVVSKSGILLEQAEWTKTLGNLFVTIKVQNTS